MEAHQKTGWRLLTLGGRDTGEISVDRRRLQDGWKRLRARFWNEFGEAPVFFACEEFGPNKGHVHLHVVIAWPKGHGHLSYATVGAWWAQAHQDADPSGADFAKNRYGKSTMTAKRAANYAAKYAAKGTEFVKNFEPRKAATMLAALKGARLVRTSVRFWLPPDPTCKQCGRDWVLANEADAQWCAAFLEGKAEHPYAAVAGRWELAKAKARGTPAKDTPPEYAGQADIFTRRVPSPLGESGETLSLKGAMWARIENRIREQGRAMDAQKGKACGNC